MHSNPTVSVRKNIPSASHSIRETQERLSSGLINTGTLANGLRVFSNHVPYVHSVTLGVWINAGSRDDPENLAGLAHFIEHAVFKGTVQRDYIEIARCIEETGGDIDAWTTKEQTCIYVRCLREHLHLAFDLLSDLVCNPVFPPEEIRKEKEVVLEEISSVNDTPEELIFDDFDQRSFPHHPLGTPILGSEESISAITIDDLQSFMRHHYVPEKMLITAVGNVDHAEVMDLAVHCLSSLGPAPHDSPARTVCRPEDYVPFTVSLKKKIYQSQILLGTVIPRHDPHFYSLMILNTMLSSGMSSMLNLELREKRGLVYTAYSSISFLDDITAFNIYAGTDSQKSALTLDTILEIVYGETLRNPVPADIEAAKSKMLGSLIMGMEKMTRRMSVAARDIFYSGRCISPAEKAAMIESVTAGDVAEAAAQLGIKHRLSTLVYKPRR